MRAGQPGHDHLRVFPSPEAAALAAAEEVRTRARAAVAARGRFTVALSGGSTPKLLFRALAELGRSPDAPAVPWQATQVFWGDERAVPPTHPDSNFGMAKRELLDRVPIPAEQVHRIHAEEAPERAAERYEETLHRCFQLAPGDLPRFDLILLGLGPDAHTASLFPGSAAVAETRRLVAAPWVATHQTYRITLTPIVLNQARAVAFLVAGEGKAGALRAVLKEPTDVSRYPAQVVQPVDGDLIWLVDHAAARELTGVPQNRS